MKKLFFLFLFVNSNLNVLAQTQAEMNQKSIDNYKKADLELNKLYSELMKVLAENEKKLLIQAQRNWIKFRDSQCEFEASEYEGGSIQPLIKYTCLEEQTQNRSMELKKILKEYLNK